MSKKLVRSKRNFWRKVAAKRRSQLIDPLNVSTKPSMKAPAQNFFKTNEDFGNSFIYSEPEERDPATGLVTKPEKQHIFKTREAYEDYMRSNRYPLVGSKALSSFVQYHGNTMTTDDLLKRVIAQNRTGGPAVAAGAPIPAPAPAPAPAPPPPPPHHHQYQYLQNSLHVTHLMPLLLPLV